MPVFYMRLRRDVTITELVDVKITAKDEQEAAEKFSDLNSADSLTSKDGTDFGELLDEKCWEHDQDSEGWSRVSAVPSSAPIPYSGEPQEAVDLDNFAPAEEEGDDIHDD